MDAYLATQQETNADLVKICLNLKVLGFKVGVDISKLALSVRIKGGCHERLPEGHHHCYVAYAISSIEAKTSQ